MNLQNRLKIAKSLLAYGSVFYRKRDRFLIAFEYYESKVHEIVRWLNESHENHNFTYDLTHINKQYLASLLAATTETEFETVQRYIHELEQDLTLRTHVLKSSEVIQNADRTVLFGRRMGWYVLTRILKPRLTVETGVEKGLGACVLTSALKRNAAEGFPGKYIGTDINPRAGGLFKQPYSEFGEILYGDSITSLKTIDEKIDLFINDSDHSAEYEAAEYETIKERLSEQAVILGDNSHTTDKLLEFSIRNDRHFVFFQEQPERHWYPGAGIGISISRHRPQHKEAMPVGHVTPAPGRHGPNGPDRARLGRVPTKVGHVLTM
jgi:predicted O-methyltransferase YrrM